jgi:putative CocE/NonD family hydrolase
MRDGVRLATDIYNADPARPRPVLLLRTPYDKKSARAQAEAYAGHDYVVVIQDCRGRYGSEGAYTPYNNDRQDGYDAIEWLNRQRWSNGRVGMFGGSHTGLVQWLAMADAAPGLAVIAPAFTSSSQYRVAYRDAVLRLALISTGGLRANPAPAPAKLPNLDLAYHDLPLLHLPIATLQEAYGWSLPWMTSLLEHPAPGGFWTQSSGEAEIAGSTIPVQIVSGYYDMFHHDAMQDFFRLKARRAKAPIQLVLGPWTHGGSGQSKVQEIDFGPAAAIDLQAVNTAWFDRCLKNQGIGPAVTVRYFVLGDNAWRDATDWPPPETQELSLYLNNGKRASFALPGEGERASEFLSDPADPVPSLSPMRKNLSRAALWSPLDYSGVSARKDVLSFLTGAVNRDLMIAGPVEAELWVSSDTPSSDWVARVFAVPAQGLPLPLAQGILRETSAAGSLHRVRVDMGSIAAHVRRGEQLRIEIAGSNFPLYDRNLHTGEGPFSSRTLVARQKVSYQRGAASRIIVRAGK